MKSRKKNNYIKITTIYKPIEQTHYCVDVFFFCFFFFFVFFFRLYRKNSVRVKCMCYLKIYIKVYLIHKTNHAYM